MFQMTVADIFFIRGRGLVATGQIEQGTLNVGDDVQINGNGAIRVEGIEMFRKKLDQANQGDNVGILLKGIDRDDIKAGDVLTTGTPAPTFAPPPPASPDISQSQDAANRALGRD
jgi:elongation factor Tu